MTRGTVALILFCGAASAQDASVTTEVQKGFEMPAHRLFTAVSSNPDMTLSPFETDGCSGGMSWSWRIVADVFPGFEEAQGATPPWEECCIVHDRAYHNGGGTTDAEASFDARLRADQLLRQCVANPVEADVTRLSQVYEVPADRIRFAYDMIAQSMFNAVRLGGGPCSGLPWRWGFGYPGCVNGL